MLAQVTRITEDWKSMDKGKSIGLKSWLHNQPALQPWSSDLTYVCPRFLPCTEGGNRILGQGKDTPPEALTFIPVHPVAVSVWVSHLPRFCHLPS